MLETQEGRNIALLIRPDEALKHRVLCSRVSAAIQRLKANDADGQLLA